MSQAGLNNTSSGPVPPSVPQSFVTDSGTAIPAANILNVPGNSSTTNVANGIQTTGVGDTLTVQLTNRLMGTATSTNGSNADIITFDLGASAAVYRFEFQVTGRETTTGDGDTYTIFGGIKTDGASATIIEDPYIDTDADTSLEDATCIVVASGNNMIIRANGVAATTVNYLSVGTYIVV